jgi:tetratricopeptide (TPR) repeat protein
MIAADRARSWALAGAIAAAIACASTPSVAHAQDGRADALFREGRALLDAKKYDEACPKLAQSHELEPGAGTLVALALCHEGQGKTATAHRELLEAAALGKRVGRTDLAAAAQKRAAGIEPTLSKVVVRVPEHERVDVKLDDRPLTREDVGVAVAVDPGEHRVVASAPRKRARTYVVRLAGAGTTEIVVDRLEDAAPVAVVAPKPAPPPIVAAEPAPAADTSTGGTQRAIGVVTMTGSLVGFGVGAYFGGRALSESSEANRACPQQGPCKDGAADDANARAKSSMNMAIIGAAAGTGALALGAIIYFTAPRAEPARGKADEPKKSARLVPSAGPREVGLGLAGTF